MKKILCINYSQSGQLDDILSNFTKNINNASIERIMIKPATVFDFPWKTNKFYDIMPETVLEESIHLEDLEFKENQYDLIILGYQPWFLSPSLPTSSLLQLEKFKSIVKNTPVITVIGARNMWLNAHTSVVNRIQSAGGKMIGNIALVDKSPNLLSAVSIVHWMLTGKKERKWGIFPKPGISDEDILDTQKYGSLVDQWLNDNQFKFQQEAVQRGAISIKTTILFIEGRAKKIFNIWAKTIKNKESKGGNRALWISIFRFYLNFALFIVAPIVLYSIQTIYTKIHSKEENPLYIFRN